MDALWLTLQESGYGAFVRNSVFLYPAANVLHVLGVMSFFGLVATMDLALLGAVGRTPAKQVIGRLRPFAVALLLLIATTGSVLFVAEAVAIAANPVFQFKVVLIGLALANVVVNEWVLRTRGDAASLARTTALLSLLAWLGVAALGRLIAYV
jgi:hypothetical protein